MRRISAVASVCVLLVLALIWLSCCPEISLAQGGRQSSSGPGPSGPPGGVSGPPPGPGSPAPDQMVYFRPGSKERWVGVTVINIGVPGLPSDLRDLRQTSSMLQNIGYKVPRNPSNAGIQVHVTARYAQMPSGEAPPAPRYSAPGGVVGAVTGLLFGVGGPGPATPPPPPSPPPMVSILTLEFDISSRGGGQQIGRITRDVTGMPVGPEQYIDAAIADYLQTALPRKR
jgi:hypothetical protein